MFRPRARRFVLRIQTWPNQRHHLTLSQMNGRQINSDSSTPRRSWCHCVTVSSSYLLPMREKTDGWEIVNWDMLLFYTSLELLRIVHISLHILLHIVADLISYLVSYLVQQVALYFDLFYSISYIYHTPYFRHIYPIYFSIRYLYLPESPVISCSPYVNSYVPLYLSAYPPLYLLPYLAPYLPEYLLILYFITSSTSSSISCFKSCSIFT